MSKKQPAAKTAAHTPGPGWREVKTHRIPNNVSPGKWQSRFIAYAKSRGLSPRKCHAADLKEYGSRGASAMPFMLWIGEMWAKFDETFPEYKNQPRNEKCHAHFDAWLSDEKPCTCGRMLFDPPVCVCTWRTK